MIVCYEQIGGYHFLQVKRKYTGTESVWLRKVDGAWNCTCAHGSLYRFQKHPAKVDTKCWHVEEALEWVKKVTKKW